MAKAPTAPAGASAAAKSVGTLLEAPVAAAVTSLARKVQIGQILADSGAIGKLGVGPVVLGDTTIQNVVLENATASIQGGRAFLQNVRVLLELRFELDWEVGISIAGHGISRSGSENLGSLSFPFAVGDVQVPSLENIHLQIPSLAASGVKATVTPIPSLDLGGASFQKLEADHTDLPADGFSLQGLGFGGLQLSGLDVPKTSTEKASLAELHLQGDVVLPGAEIANLQLPQAAAGNVVGQSFGFDAVPGTRSIVADLGILKIALKVHPVAHTRVDAMMIQDVKLAAAVGKLKLEEIRVPLTVLGVTLQQITLEGVRIANVSL